MAHWEEESENETSKRGQSSKFSDEQIALVVALWKTYNAARKKVKFSAFMKQLRKAWKNTEWMIPCPARKTAEDMLLANGVRKPKSQKPKAPHINKVKEHFPNAQVLLDGKVVDVIYKDQAYHVTIEFCKDIAAGATTGVAVGQSESYELVKKALEEHRAQYGDPLAILTDNGPANRPLEIELGNQAKLLIRAWPYRPQTKGHIENEFSIFEKNISRIEIKGHTDQDIVMSIVEVIARLYLRLRNQTPRCATCPMTPQKLMAFKPSERENENAYRALATERDKRRTQQEQALKISAEQADLIDSIVKEHRLTGDRFLLKKTLRHVELAALKEAERRFFMASERDTFDPSKRKMAYFCRIALNVQKECNEARQQQIANRRYGLDQKVQREREKRQLDLKHRTEELQFQKHPDEAILENFQAYQALPSDFRKSTTFWRVPLDEAIESIKNRRNASRRQELIECTRQKVLAHFGAPLDLRYEYINIVEARMIELGLKLAKSVTPN